MELKGLGLPGQPAFNEQWLNNAERLRGSIAAFLLAGGGACTTSMSSFKVAL